MKKSSGSSQKLGSFLSPGTSNYKEKGQKGSSSDRVVKPSPTSSSHIHRHGSVAALTPFNSYSRRTMPSKWDDAERWICSPVSGYANSNKTSLSYAQLQPRPKSKSGPIVPPPTAYYSNYSPTNTIPLSQGLVVRNLMVGSPFTTGVLAPDAISLHHFDAAHDTVFYGIDNRIQYSSPVISQNHAAPPSISSAPSWSQLLCDPSSPNSQDEKCDGTMNEDTMMSPMNSKCDKGTQMSSPESESDADAHSSPKSCAVSAVDQKDCHSTKLEIRDVEVDCQATIIRWSKSRTTKHKLPHGKNSKEGITETQSSYRDNADSTPDISNFQREEAKIIAWESLQKAKAEESIRKLEMKLEKKRSLSMDKILNKLRRSQMKAEKMRSSIPVKQEQQISKPWKLFSFPKYAQILSPSSCFSSDEHDP